MSTIWIRINLAFVLVFLAGGIVGYLIPRSPAPGPRPTERRGFLTEQLDLTDEQASAIKLIWNGVMKEQGPAHWRQRRELYRDREAAVESLLTEDQRGQYDAIMAANDQAQAELRASWEARINDAVARTKALLTPEQAARYDEIRPRGRWGRGGRGPRDHHDRLGQRHDPADSHSHRDIPHDSRGRMPAPINPGPDAKPASPAPHGDDPR